MTPSDQANRQFWAARRANAPRPPDKLSVADFVAEANKLLSADKAWDGFTRFIIFGSPVGGSPAATWEGPETMRPLVQRVYQELARRFELPVPFRIDRI